MTKDTLSLYDLAEEAVALDDLTAMDDGEWTPEAESLFEELVNKLVLKADAFGAFVRDCEASADAIKVEESRLAARRKALDTKAAKLKRYALTALQRMGRDKIEGTIFSLRVQRNAPSVVVSTPAASLPSEYQRHIPADVQADKTAIATALKAGVEIDGCELVTSYSLRVK